jgi:hypothetical protein
MDKLKLTTRIAKALKSEIELYKALDKTLFSDLIAQVMDLSKEDIRSIFPDTVYESKNLKALAELRNAVSHNRFLLNYLDFKECNIDGSISGSLHANLTNLANHLEQSIKLNFINEINSCSAFEENNGLSNPFQTEWNLPNFVKIVL